MAYLGNDLQVAYPTYKNIDDISGSFNSSTTSFPLRVNGVAPVPPPLNSQQCLISVGGVIQRPDDTGTEGFRLSGGNIIFASAPTTGADFFGVILAGADYINVGANFPSGTAAVPSITFDSDLDTGIFNAAANEIGFATGGVQRFHVNSAGQLNNNLGTAGAPSYSFTGDLNTGIYSPGADQVAISTGGSGRLFIDSSGRVGVGTSTFAAANHALTVAGGYSVLNGLRISGADTANSIYQSGAFGLSSDNYITFGTGGSQTERLRITSAGLVGIGTTSPNSVLQVNSGTNLGGILVGFNSGSSNFYDADLQVFRTGNGTERARIDSSGRLLVGTSTARSNDGVTPRYFQEGANTFEALGICSNGGADAGKAAYIFLSRSGGTTAGSSTIVANGDIIGAINFYGADGTDIESGVASIQCRVDGTPGANDMPGRLVFSTCKDGSASPTLRFQINNGGAHGIVCESDTDGLYVSNAASAGTTRYLLIGRHSATVGTPYSGTSSFVVFTNGNVQNTNNSYAGISDVKLKENIADASSQWSDIKALQVRKYSFKKETGQQTHTQIGLIAQEVELVSPGLVTESPDRDAEGNDLGTVTKSVNYSVLYMKAVKALQEAMERIEQLEAKVAALESA